MVYYERLGDAYTVASSYGITGALPPLSNKTIHEAKILGQLRFREESARLYQIFDGHIIITPESSILPPDIADEIRRIGSLSIFSNGKFRLYPHDVLSAKSAFELVHLGLSRNFLYGSFFILTTDVLIRKVMALCPHAIPDSIGNELQSMALTILGSSGHAVGFKNNSCFCVFYSHTLIDAELVATQVVRTLCRSVSTNDADTALTGSWHSGRLSDENAISGLSSFIEGVEPRPQA
ncbi:MAG: hypothetical protein A2Z96_01965 [Spirochaetes bacterium GWB1_48_6]|nr:MAG: hypothetical protein A2Z96_01965 [Spirochaetes bacterium GWB1_48_6]